MQACLSERLEEGLAEVTVGLRGVMEAEALQLNAETQALHNLKVHFSCFLVLLCAALYDITSQSIRLKQLSRLSLCLVATPVKIAEVPLCMLFMCYECVTSLSTAASQRGMTPSMLMIQAVLFLGGSYHSLSC